MNDSEVLTASYTKKQSLDGRTTNFEERKNTPAKKMNGPHLCSLSLLYLKKELISAWKTGYRRVKGHWGIISLRSNFST